MFNVKRFKKFSIKTLSKIVCSNFQNKQKIGLNPLGLSKLNSLWQVVQEHTNSTSQINVMKKVEGPNCLNMANIYFSLSI